MRYKAIQWHDNSSQGTADLYKGIAPLLYYRKGDEFIPHDNWRGWGEPLLIQSETDGMFHCKSKLLFVYVVISEEHPLFNFPGVVMGLYHMIYTKRYDNIVRYCNNEFKALYGKVIK
jgi:hypothetical protein